MTMTTAPQPEGPSAERAIREFEEWLNDHRDQPVAEVFHEIVAKFALAAPEVPAPVAEPVAWRCFHCDECFTDRDAAQTHFGLSEHDLPICQMDPEYIRWLLAQHRRNVDDDSEALRTVGGLVSAHEALRKRAEEEGYARGIEDAKKHPEELGLAPAVSPPPAAQEVPQCSPTLTECPRCKNVIGNCDRALASPAAPEGQ